MNRTLKTLLAAALLTGAASPAHAVVVSWTDWQRITSLTSVLGRISHEGETIDVTFTGAMSGAVTSGSPFDYWSEGTPPAYTSGVVENAPPEDIITFRNITPRSSDSYSITFSQAVVDPYIALVGWGDQTVEFDNAIELVSSGFGYEGIGSFSLNPAGTGFTTEGEFHGIFRLKGTFTSFTFSDAFSDNWRGFTIGIGNPEEVVEPVETPEPAALGLLGLGLIGAARLRRRKTA